MLDSLANSELFLLLFLRRMRRLGRNFRGCLRAYSRGRGETDGAREKESGVGVQTFFMTRQILTTRSQGLGGAGSREGREGAGQGAQGEGLERGGGEGEEEAQGKHREDGGGGEGEREKKARVINTFETRF